jgi:hypothetical protein
VRNKSRRWSVYDTETSVECVSVSPGEAEA